MPQGELQTDALVRQALRDQKQVYVPFLYKETLEALAKPASVMDMVSLHSLEDYEALKPDAWGIPSVPNDSIGNRRRCLPMQVANGEILDLVILPGVAFGKDGRRLGHGKGFYDTFLTRYERALEAKDADSAMPYLVGMALHEQIAIDRDTIPMDDTDWLVDAVIVGDDDILERGS